MALIFAFVGGHGLDWEAPDTLQPALWLQMAPDRAFGELFGAPRAQNCLLLAAKGQSQGSDLCFVGGHGFRWEGLDTIQPVL